MKIRKYYIYIFSFIIIFSPVFTYSQWVKCSNGLDIQEVRAITINGNYIFAGTWGGGIYLSSSNGNTWTSINNAITDSVDYFGVNNGDIFAGSENMGLLLSTNNGST